MNGQSTQPGRQAALELRAWVRPWGLIAFKIPWAPLTLLLSHPAPLLSLLASRVLTLMPPCLPCGRLEPWLAQDPFAGCA